MKHIGFAMVATASGTSVEMEVAGAGLGGSMCQKEEWVRTGHVNLKMRASSQ